MDKELIWRAKKKCSFPAAEDADKINVPLAMLSSSGEDISIVSARFCPFFSRLENSEKLTKRFKTDQCYSERCRI